MQLQKKILFAIVLFLSSTASLIAQNEQYIVAPPQGDFYYLYDKQWRVEQYYVEGERSYETMMLGMEYIFFDNGDLLMVMGDYDIPFKWSIISNNRIRIEAIDVSELTSDGEKVYAWQGMYTGGLLPEDFEYPAHVNAEFEVIFIDEDDFIIRTYTSCDLPDCFSGVEEMRLVVDLED
jgi:hypothetical protein